SGAGFPGLVLAIMGAGEVTLIESDRKKCEFLREAARVTETSVRIINERVENLTAENRKSKDEEINTFDIITSRATAALSQLFEWSAPLMKQDGICLFPKGENWATEVEEAKKHWSCDLQILPSASSATGCII